MQWKNNKLTALRSSCSVIVVLGAFLATRRMKIHHQTPSQLAQDWVSAGIQSKPWKRACLCIQTRITPFRMCLPCSWVVHTLGAIVGQQQEYGLSTIKLPSSCTFGRPKASTMLESMRPLVQMVGLRRKRAVFVAEHSI